MKKGLTGPILSGALLGAATSHESLGCLGWIAIIPVLRSLRTAKTTKEGFWQGSLMGLTMFLGGLAWISTTTTIGWIGMGWLAIYPAIWGACAQKVLEKEKEGEGWRSAILLTAIWGMTETARRSWVPFGMIPIGSSVQSLSLLQNAAWGGEWVLGSMVVGTNAILEGAWENLMGKRKREWLAVGIWATALTGLYGWGEWKLGEKQEGQEIKVTILSTETGNINGEANFEEREEWLKKSKGNADLVVWPEILWGDPLHNQELLDQIKEGRRQEKGALITGCTLWESDKESEGKYNGVILLDNQGSEAEVYHKEALVPLREYLPGWMPKDWRKNKFKAGKEQKCLTTKGTKIGILLCVEETVAQLGIERAREGAEILVAPSNNLTTTKWGAKQQEIEGRLRAIETNRPLIRASNKGFSGAFDCQGRKIAETNRSGETTITIEKGKGETPIVKMGKTNGGGEHRWRYWGLDGQN